MILLSRGITALYIRVSTDAQIENYSIDEQKERLLGYCKSKGIKKYSFYIDGGFSGSNLDRPEIQRLIRDSLDGLISTVIVFKLDRLSRSQKDTLYLIEDVFLPNDTDFISINESFDTSSPYGKAMLGILSVFAQLERENIKLRTRMGMVGRVKTGLWMGGGRTPYGYNYDRNSGLLVPNENAEKVRKMYELYLKGYSCQAIADMFDLKYEKLVRGILMRKSNAGYIVYNGIEYKGKHQPIVDEETYNRTVSRMTARSDKKITSSQNLLTGLICCGVCGAKMHYQIWGKRKKISCYSQQSSKPYLIKDENCDNFKHWSEDVERLVLEDLFSFCSRVTVVENNKLESPESKIQKQIVLLENKIKRLYNLYADGGDQILLETIQENKKSLDSLKKEYEKSKAETHRKESRNKTLEMLSSVEGVWDTLTIKERKSVLSVVIDKIVVKYDEVNVFYKI